MVAGSGAEDAYDLAHGRLREEVYERVSAERRRELHRLLAEELGQRNDAARAVEHWRAAGEPERAREAALAAARSAEEKLATGLRVRIRSEEATEDRLSALLQLLEAQPGSCAVTLHVLIPDHSETVIAVSAVRGVRPDEKLRADLDALFGRGVTEVAI